MRLWIKVVRLFQTIDFEQVDEFDQFKNINNKEVAGFASMYLLRCEVESKSDDEIDIRVYTKLVELDSRLGTTAAEQLLHWQSQSLVLRIFRLLCMKKLTSSSDST